MQNNIVAGCIKEFLTICKPKTKKINFVKTVTTLGLYIVKKKVRMGDLESYFCLQMI